MATLDQLNTEVIKWMAILRRATNAYNSAFDAIYGDESGDPLRSPQHERAWLTKCSVVEIRKKLEDAQAALKAFKDKAERDKNKNDYDVMWKHEPTLWEAYRMK